ncbi:DUF2059 domain-containing protein [Parasalinivibrio latis]|uniref:DUF2059 domain-containing protein n=1 Tax=Parasalinivibrio latis TaxID=2952610 RepID=UPI0030DF22D7
MNRLFLVLMLFFPLSAMSAPAPSERVQKLVNLMNMDSIVDVLDTQMQSMTNNIAQQANLQPDERALFEEYQAGVQKIAMEELNWANLEPQIIALYAEHFSEKEIEDMIAFYQTETGQSVIRKMPAITQASMQMSIQMVQRAAPKLQKYSQEFARKLQAKRSGAQ